MRALSDGGFQVGALARIYHPDGFEIENSDHKKAADETRALLERDNVTIYEAAFAFEHFFVRVDVLVKTGNSIELIEVKAASYDRHKDEFFDKRLLKKGAFRLTLHWKKYLYDVAFQTLVCRKAFPEFNFTPHMMFIRINWSSIYNSEEKSRFEEMRQIARQRGGRCLSSRYLGRKAYYKWECKNNHQWDASGDAIVNQGTWCAVCAGKARITLKDLQDAAKSKGGRLLSKKFTIAARNYQWICKSGHRWQASGANVLRGTWCGKCHHQNNRSRCRAVWCSDGKIYPSVQSAAEATNLNRVVVSRLLKSGKQHKTGVSFKYSRKKNSHIFPTPGRHQKSKR